jgi:hypothetical protein
MAGILLPFALMSLLVQWQREIRIAAGAIVVAFGLLLLVRNRHPRFLARVPPSRLALWSFLAATAHGAGLMLLPIYLGLCGAEPDGGHRAAAVLMAQNAGYALVVSIVHTLAMMIAAGAIAFAVYRWLDLTIINRTWFNLDRVWAASLALVGLVGLGSAL